ncbi:hypothetical protein M0R45_009233 [Rubus argutus]|uniref:Uncharacterized protein n=1 Tax=Rubus argutus TaxID=59490 RepID=A0AAW1Y590_RUBAR
MVLHITTARAYPHPQFKSTKTMKSIQPAARVALPCSQSTAAQDHRGLPCRIHFHSKLTKPSPSPTVAHHNLLCHPHSLSPQPKPELTITSIHKQPWPPLCSAAN